MKKLFAVLLTLAMLLTLSVPVFANGNTEQESTGNMVTLEGASARLAEPSGLRFQTEISKEYYNSLSNVKMGTLIAPEAYVEQAGAFTKEALETLTVDGAKYLDVKAGEFYEETDPSYVFAGSIANIKENHRDLRFAGIGYIEYEKDGKTVVEYSSRYSVRSVSSVAASALGDLAFEEGQQGYANKVGENLWSPYTEEQRKVLSALRGNVFEIETVEQFVCFSNLVNTKLDNFSGKTVKLTADLDFSGVANFVPVGNNPAAGNDTIYTWGSNKIQDAAHFAGTFDGQGHSITGLKQTFNQGHTGLFGVTQNAAVRNLYLNAEFSNTSDKWHNGALIGLAANTVVEFCYVGGKYESTSAGLVGGIIGASGENVNVSNSMCDVDGSAIGGSYLGGFVGYSYASVSLNNCYLKTVAVKGTGDNGTWGAFVGHGAGITVANCYGVYTAAVEGATNNLVGTGTVTASELLTTVDALNDKLSKFDGAFISETNPMPDMMGLSEISTVEELLRFAEFINSGLTQYKGRTVVLKADLDLSDMQWTPIGNQQLTNTNMRNMFEWNAFNQDWFGGDPKPFTPLAFSGTFDGQGHKIIGLKMEGCTADLRGFFGLLMGATVKNLHVDGALSMKGVGFYAGLLAGGAIQSRFENCSVNGTVRADYHYQDMYVNNIGGFVGAVSANNAGDDSVMVNCHAVVDMTKSAQYTCGGLIGSVFGTNGSLTVTGCYVDISEISAHEPESKNVGLLIGLVAGDCKVTVKNSYAVSGAASCDTLVAPGAADKIGKTILMENCRVDKK